MALGAMDKYKGVRVSIVPVGLNYFKGTPHSLCSIALSASL